MTTTTDRSVILDAYAAHDDGLVPEHLIPTPEQHQSGEYVAVEAALVEYVVDHGLVGHVERRRAERGVADVCPDWCDVDHARTEVLGPDEGRTHYGPGMVVPSTDDGTVVVEVEQHVEVEDGQAQAGPVHVYVEVESGTTPCFTPAAARDLAAALLAAADAAEAAATA